MPIYQKALKNAIFPKEKGVDYLKIILFLSLISGIIFNLITVVLISSILLVIHISFSIKKRYKLNINDENYLPDGTHIIYIQHISPKVVVNLKNGKRDGLYTQYFKNGIQLQFQNHYSNGKYNGLCKEFYDNGQLKILSTWKNGIQEGKTYYYNNDGSLIRELEIVNGDYYKECIEYNKNGKIKFINNGNKFTFFEWNIDFTKKLKVCEINYDLIKEEFLGIWRNYNANEEIDYELDFNNAIIIEKKSTYKEEWYKIGYKVKKIIYNSNGEEDSSKFVYIRNYFQKNQIDSKLSWYRFNDIAYYKSSGIKGPPGISTGSYIKIKPLLSILDLIEFEEESYFVENDNIRLVPTKTLNAIEFYQRGVEKDANSEYEEAIINFTKAIEIDSKYIDAYRSRASARIWINDYEGIVNDHTKIIELNSEDSDAYESRGRAKASLNDYIGAIEDFNNAIELDKESKVYSSRGRIKKLLFDFDGALQDYNIAVEKFPENDSSFFGRGELKYEIEDYLGAIIDFNKCIELKPNRIMSYYKRGDCKLKIEDYNGAIADYTTVIQNRQDKYGIDGTSSENGTKLFASLYHKRGIARSKINKYTDAITDFKKAIELNPNSINEVKDDLEMTIKQQG